MNDAAGDARVRGTFLEGENIVRPRSQHLNGGFAAKIFAHTEDGPIERQRSVRIDNRQGDVAETVRLDHRLCTHHGIEVNPRAGPATCKASLRSDCCNKLRSPRIPWSDRVPVRRSWSEAYRAGSCGIRRGGLLLTTNW